MLKTVLKEAGIIVLLLIAICLIFGILFYDYIPNNKTIPAKVEPYAFPADVKEELSKTFKEEQKIVKTFYIDSSDLNVYESAKEYNKGKANPFAQTTTTTNNTSGTTNSGSSSTSSSSNGTSTNKNNTTNTTNNQENYTNNKSGKLN